MLRRRPSPATVIATVALFAALGGTAIAARHYLITSTSQIKPSVLRRLRGRAGPRGRPGASGPRGPGGPQGPPGPSPLSAVSAYHAPTQQVPDEEIATSVATCPSGSHAISGGGYSGLADWATSTMSADHQSWILAVINVSGDATDIEASVDCAGAGQAIAASAAATSAAHARAVRQAGAIAARLRRELRTGGP